MFAILSVLSEETAISIFQARDLYRARELWNGVPIFFGPETNSGGNLPGSFYYFLIGLPLQFFSGWMAPWYFMLGLFCAGCALQWNWFYKRFGPLEGLMAILLPLTSFTLMRSLSGFVNPSYILLFVVAITLLLIRAFSEDSEKVRLRTWCLASLLMGLALQIHFSIIYLLAGALLTKLLATRLRIPSPSWRHLSFGLFCFLAPLLPYLLRLGLELPETHGRSSSGIIDHILGGIRRSQIGISSWSWNEFHVFHQLFVFAAVLIVFSLWTRLTKQPLFKTSLSVPRAAFFVPLFAFLLSLISSGSFFVYSNVRWYHHAYLSVELMTFIIVLLFGHLSSNRLRFGFLGLYMIALVAVNWTGIPSPENIFFVVGAVAALLYFTQKRLALLWEKFAYAALIASCIVTSLIYLQFYQDNLSIQSMKFPVWRDMRDVVEYVSKDSGANFSTLRDRIFAVGTIPDVDYSVFFEGRPQTSKKTTLEGGYFLVMFPPIKNSTDLLQREDFNNNLKQLIVSGVIHLGELKTLGEISVIPYKVQNNSFAPHFGNIGRPYWDYGLKLWSPSAQYDQDASLKKIQFQTCPNGNPSCQVDFYIGLISEKRQLRVAVSGIGVSQMSQYIVQDWTQIIYKPFVNWKCGTRSGKVTLVDSLGIEAEKLTGLFVAAPFERNIDVPCDALDTVSIGWESGNAHQQLYELNFPLMAQEKSVQL